MGFFGIRHQCLVCKAATWLLILRPSFVRWMCCHLWMRVLAKMYCRWNFEVLCSNFSSLEGTFGLLCSGYAFLHHCFEMSLRSRFLRAMSFNEHKRFFFSFLPTVKSFSEVIKGLRSHPSVFLVMYCFSDYLNCL